MSEEELIEKINNLQTVNKYTYINNQGNNNINLFNALKALNSKTIGHQENSVFLGKRVSPSKIFVNNYSNSKWNLNNKKNNNYGSSSNDNKGNGYLRNKSPQLSLPQILPPIVNKANKERSSSPYKGIFNKYEYLASKDKIAQGSNGVSNRKSGKKALSVLRKNYVISSANKLNKKDSNLSVNRNGSLDEKILDDGNFIFSISIS